MEINLDTLGNGIMGLTQEIGNYILQACSVCLENQNHSSGVSINIVYPNGNQSASLIWNVIVDKQVERNWGDLQEATEYAATGIAIKLAELFSGSHCIERSSKGTGVDYWLGDEDELGIFQRKARLEISGILKETTSNSLEKRLKVKTKQTQKSMRTGMAAHVCIVEFSNPKGEYQII